MKWRKGIRLGSSYGEGRVIGPWRRKAQTTIRAAWHKVKPVRVESAEGRLFLPNEFYIPERKGYACIFPPIPCPHTKDESDTLAV